MDTMKIEKQDLIAIMSKLGYDVLGDELPSTLPYTRGVIMFRHRTFTKTLIPLEYD